MEGARFSFWNDGGRLLDSSTVITSTANDSVKYARSLQRKRSRYQEKAFIAEGLRTLEEAIKVGTEPTLMFCTPEVLEQPRARVLVLRAEQVGAQVKVVSEQVMKVMAGTVTPSGLLAVLPMIGCSIPRPLSWVLVIDRLRDPGNMGTVLRSALAAGVELVITTKGTVDVYSPKVVRAAVGAHFRLKLCLDQSWQAIEDILQGLRVLLADPRQGHPYWEVDWHPPTALWIGGEAAGASPQAEKMISGHVTVPMREGVESLNAAVAASVLLFEASRQRSSCGC
jgi:TrmH family RNA methyltransferase